MTRNPEAAGFGIIYLAASLCLIAAGFFSGFIPGALMTGAAVIFGCLFFAFTRSRYKRLARMSAEIDTAIHHSGTVNIAIQEEGELSILETQIRKLLTRLRDSNETLKIDRQYLADSLADIAHQMRTPLTTANLLLSLLMAQDLMDGSRERLMELSELVVRMEWLITMLLKISRLDAGVENFQFQNIPVCDIITDAAAPLILSLELRKISLKTDIPGELRINADRQWLSQAIQNILKNCMESVVENGTITVDASENVLYTQIVIADDGKGFHEADLPHVFDRFYRARDAASSGFGIGLALSKMVIGRHSGKIAARNREEDPGGAVFTMRFEKPV